MRLQHDAGEVDERSDRRLRVAAGTALELLALALRRQFGTGQRYLFFCGFSPGTSLEPLVTHKSFLRQAAPCKAAA
jgi:hypothetical protein